MNYDNELDQLLRDGEMPLDQLLSSLPRGVLGQGKFVGEESSEENLTAEVESVKEDKSCEEQKKRTRLVKLYKYCQW